MEGEESQIIYAHVVMKPPRGNSLAKDAKITVQTLAEFVPLKEDVHITRKFFEEAGFDTTSLAGISFDISGPVHQFEAFFKTTMRIEQTGSVSVQTNGENNSYELPLHNLRDEITQLVEAIELSPPPDFGPISYFC